MGCRHVPMAQTAGQQSLSPLSAVVWSEVATPAWSFRNNLELGPLQWITVCKGEVHLSSLTKPSVLITSLVRGGRSHQPWDRVRDLLDGAYF